MKRPWDFMVISRFLSWWLIDIESVLQNVLHSIMQSGYKSVITCQIYI